MRCRSRQCAREDGQDSTTPPSPAFGRCSIAVGATRQLIESSSRSSSVPTPRSAPDTESRRGTRVAATLRAINHVRSPITFTKMRRRLIAVGEASLVAAVTVVSDCACPDPAVVGLGALHDACPEPVGTHSVSERRMVTAQDSKRFWRPSSWVSLRSWSAVCSAVRVPMSVSW